jgi:DNA polymerase sigma
MSLQLSGIISLLHNHHKMTEIDIRLRYFLASSIEEMLTKMFPHCQANLFGSSVNGLGNTGCDLDVDIDFSWDVYSNVSLQEERCLVVSNIERKFCLKFSVDKWVTRVVGMAVNATFNNSSVISWRSVLLV